MGEGILTSKLIETRNFEKFTRNNSTGTSVRILDPRFSSASWFLPLSSKYLLSTLLLIPNFLYLTIHEFTRAIARERVWVRATEVAACARMRFATEVAARDGIERQKPKEESEARRRRRKRYFPPSSKRVDSKTRIRFSQVSVSLYG